MKDSRHLHKQQDKDTLIQFKCFQNQLQDKIIKQASHKAGKNQMHEKRIQLFVKQCVASNVSYAVLTCFHGNSSGSGKE